MENQLSKTIKNSIKRWYLLLLLGIISITVGIWVFLTPLASYTTLSVLFACTFLLTGMIEIIMVATARKVNAISNRNQLHNWGWSLMSGIIEVTLGILLLSQPRISMLVLPFYIGFGILYQSVMAIGWSLELKKYNVMDWGNLLGIGILGLILAFIMLWNPLFAGMTIVFYTASAFIIVGISQIYLSFKLRKFNNLLTSEYVT